MLDFDKGSACWHQGEIQPAWRQTFGKEGGEYALLMGDCYKPDQDTCLCRQGKLEEKRINDKL